MSMILTTHGYPQVACYGGVFGTQWLDPAPVPHAGGPRRVRDDLTCEDRIEVPEQHQHRKHVRPGNSGPDGPAPWARPHRPDDQPQAERDAHHEEREELQRVVVELGGPLEEQEPGEPAR